jgi:transcriptional regulator with PAS, ATPase and Fis domain
MGVTGKQRAQSPPIVGISQAIRDVIELADNVAPSDCCVLIEGESGTGKELIARRICLKSRRADRPFLPVNCAGISETLFESQFFGHLRGAFTGAEQNMLGVIRTAEGGTVFLDEVSEISLALQPKLLRVLQEQEVMPVGSPVPVKVDARFLAGTNRNLQQMVQEGSFRGDIYYRLNIVRIVIPPLRERVEDIPALLDYFSSLLAAHYGRELVEITPQARSLLLSYPWPGNIRELAAWVERLYVTGREPDELIDMLLREGLPSSGLPAGSPRSLKEAERVAIVQALEHSDFNQRKAARVLQVHRATLARKLKRHRLS